MTKPPITHLIIDTWSTNDDYNGDCDYALVPLTLQYVSDLLWYMEEVGQLHKVDDNIYALERWDGTPSYFRFNEKLETIKDFRGRLAVKVPKGVPILLTADPRFQEEDFQRVDCCTVQVDKNEVWWSAYVKHTNTLITTAPVSRETLQKIVNRFAKEGWGGTARQFVPVHPAIRQIYDLLYLDMQGTKFFYNPDKSWDSETLDQVAKIVAQYIPRPPPLKPHGR
jgi:hypothetical protein